MKKRGKTKTDTWMPLYIADYLADTSHLSTAQSGAYLHLLMHYWRNGPLPDDDVALARIVRSPLSVFKRHISAPIRSFFDAHAGLLYQSRIERELEHSALVSAKRKEAANTRYYPPNGGGGEHANALQLQASEDANALQMQNPGDANALQTDMQKGGHPQSHPQSQEGKGRRDSLQSQNPPSYLLPSLDSELACAREAPGAVTNPESLGAMIARAVAAGLAQGGPERERPVQTNRAEFVPRHGAPPQAWEHLSDRHEWADRQGFAGPVKNTIVGNADPMSGAVIDIAFSKCLEWAGINPATFRGDARPVIAWLRDGYHIGEQIKPAIMRLTDYDNYQPRSIQSLKYFDNEIRKLIPMYPPPHEERAAAQ